MKIINYNFYEVYYLDNDRQKVILAEKQNYSNAVKLSQHYYSEYNINAEYKAIY